MQLIGIDVGGTFTDFVWLVEGELRVHKEATTVRDQSVAVLEGLDHLGVSRHAMVVHGMTVATNALLERRGARTALLTTEGFADVLAIGRQNRRHLYRLSQHRPPPLVPKARRFGVPERLDAEGSVVTPLDEAEVRRVADRLVEEGVESCAIVFLFSFQQPAHEQRAAELIRKRLPDLPLSLSSDILPEYREYERTATTVINAYVHPEVARYLTRLDDALGDRPVRVMQSNGGTIRLQQAAEQAARLVLSGPAGGVVGAFGLAQRALDTEAPQVLTLDMGGTSTDVALCPGSIPRSSESIIADLPLRLPTTEIHTVGAGGGSIARVDAGGVLRVGPESAGADPGPVCYGQGGAEPTVTDANLVLGRLDADYFLGGDADLQLDAAAARKALRSLGKSLGLTPEKAALGVLRVANTTMERALRRVSVERGHDPREYVLIPFGGAGPMHACDLADTLDIRQVLVPPSAGVLSALGLLMADVVYDTSHALLQHAEDLTADPAPLRILIDELADQVRTALRDDAEPSIDVGLDMRYTGQSYELDVPLSLPVSVEHVEQAVADFHAAHERRYGHSNDEEPVEVVTVRVRGHLPGAQPTLPEEPPTERSIQEAVLGEKPVWFDPAGPLSTVCYDRRHLHHGHDLEGPAIVFQYDTTLVIPPDWHACVDAWRNVWVTKG